ncbi:MAG: insulinase family protein [Acidobacteria bacterium]|nr:insulinase family protein [Acidobacteriota bacterium]
MSGIARKFHVLVCVILLLCFGSVPVSSAQKAAGSTPAAGSDSAKSQHGLPAHPKDLTYPKLDYTPPKASNYRQVLSSGVVAYMVEDNDLPLVNITVLIRVGQYAQPAGKEGLASLAGSQMRAGGTASKSAEEFDEAADYLAAQIQSYVTDTQGVANLNCLSKELDTSLQLFFDMLRNPRFQQDRLDLAKSQTLQQMERRNDRTEEIEDREWSRLIRGADFFTNRSPTKASVESINREDLVAFHRKYFHPGSLMLAVSGDFHTKEMVAKLESVMKGWTAERAAAAGIPEPTATPVPGIYTVNKADVNQGRVLIGHRGSMRNNPDSYALTIMNDILGGPDFTSRLLSRVRSDEGLAYDAGSEFGLGVYFPGYFRARFQSKNATCAQAISIVLDEINRIRTVRVSEEELTTSKNQAIGIFPRFFATALLIANTFAADEFTGRPAGYWEAYRDRIAAVTAQDVQRVAREYLHPDKLVFLIVGNIQEILKGSPDKPEYSISRMAANLPIHSIPLPDPLTMIYPKNEPKLD